MEHSTDKRTVVTCEGCEQRPSIGILNDGGERFALCQFCVPNSPMFDFSVYREDTTT